MTFRCCFDRRIILLEDFKQANTGALFSLLLYDFHHLQPFYQEVSFSYDSEHCSENYMC